MLSNMTILVSIKKKRHKNVVKIKANQKKKQKIVAGQFPAQ